MAGKNAKPRVRAAKRKTPTSDSLLGWLGRQVGHVKKAVTTDVTRPAQKAKGARPAPENPPTSSATSTVVYRHDKVEEAELPDKPGVKLRRTIIDEVIVARKADSGESWQNPKN